MGAVWSLEEQIEMKKARQRILEEYLSFHFGFRVSIGIQQVRGTIYACKCNAV